MYVSMCTSHRECVHPPPPPARGSRVPPPGEARTQAAACIYGAVSLAPARIYITSYYVTILYPIHYIISCYYIISYYIIILDGAAGARPPPRARARGAGVWDAPHLCVN